MPRRNALESLSVTDLRHEMARRQRRGQALLRKRAKLAAKLRAMDAAIAELGVPGQAGVRANGEARRRPHNEMTLVEALEKAVGSKPMGLSEIIDAVQKAGYRSNAGSFRLIVNQALINSGKFKRAGRGMYAAK